MSSTQRSPRPGTDTYYTPSWCTHRLIEATPQLPGGVWIDAGAGNGEILNAVKDVRQDIVWCGVELREECAPALERSTTVSRICDFTTLTLADSQRMLRQVSHKSRFDGLIMNPPFKLAFEFLQLALQIADHVLMLQRLNYLGSKERSAFFRRYTPDLYVLPNRPIFEGSHGDSVEYGWFYWGPAETRERDKGSLQILAETPLAERRKLRKVSRVIDALPASEEALAALPAAQRRADQLEALERSAEEEYRETPGHGEESL